VVVEELAIRVLSWKCKEAVEMEIIWLESQGYHVISTQPGDSPEQVWLQGN